MIINNDYHERVYAGVLGKLIGVYLGRPFEGWSHEQIIEKLGPIEYYVHEKLNKLLVVTDDDIAGTFTFLRALPDHGNDPDLSPEQIGKTWLNYLIEGRTILWWGGLGNSTEHMAYLRLKNGISAPLSGSALLNSVVQSEQIGAQIFIDGWAMAMPGDPERAADFARRAASVSHDGEAIYAAQILAAMESQAFVENDLEKLLETAIHFIPKNSVTYRLISDLRSWHAKEPEWQTTFQKIKENYGYDRYCGNCHVIPNHALIQLALLYGDNDFQKTLMIANTCGWDTDCNSGNAGCLLGIKNGLAGIDHGPDWRGPVADRLYLSTADGGRAITDAVTESFHIINTCYGLNKKDPIRPKRNARFHFEFPGSVQGFQASEEFEARDTLSIQNVAGYSEDGDRCLELIYHHLAPGRVARAGTHTFIPPEAIETSGGYKLFASPTLYPGQKLSARLSSDQQNASTNQIRLFIRFYGSNDEQCIIFSPGTIFNPGDVQTIEWIVPSTEGSPIFEVGVEITAQTPSCGSVYLDYLTWEGEPETFFPMVSGNGAMWRRAWIEGVDYFFSGTGDPYRLVQNEGRGLLIQGTHQWKNYRFQAEMTPHFANSCGIAVHVQGMFRYMAVLFNKNQTVDFKKVLDEEITMAREPFNWNFEQTYHLVFQVQDNHFQFWVEGQLIFDLSEVEPLLDAGGIALVCEEGCASYDNIRVSSFTK